MSLNLDKGWSLYLSFVSMYKKLSCAILNQPPPWQSHATHPRCVVVYFLPHLTKNLMSNQCKLADKKSSVQGKALSTWWPSLAPQSWPIRRDQACAGQQVFADCHLVLSSNEPSVAGLTFEFFCRKDPDGVTFDFFCRKDPDGVTFDFFVEKTQMVLLFLGRPLTEWSLTQSNPPGWGCHTWW